jgi:hypothetical protein
MTKRYFVKDENKTKEYLLCGVLTGFALSFLETPTGVILEQIHGNLNRHHTHAFDFHVKDCCKYIYENNEGLRGFYKEFFPEIFKAIPINAACFLVYEEVYRLLE